MEKEGRKKRKEGEERKEGTQLINATGRRPFKIFKIKKVLLSN